MAYPDTINAHTGLLYYWQCDDSASPLTPDAGSINLVVTGGTFQATGQVGDAVSLNGSSDSVSTASALSALSSEDHIFVEGLFYFDSTSGLQIFLELTTDFNNTAGAFAVYLNSGTLTVSHFGNASYNSADYTPPSTSAWHHCVFEINPSDSSAPDVEVNFYLDGSLQTPSSRSQDNNSNNIASDVLYIGARDNSSYYCGMDFQHLAIYDGTLTSTEIAAHSTEAFNPSTAPTITDFGDEDHTDGDSVTATVTNAGSTQGNGTIYISNSSTWGEGTIVEQTDITSWSDTSLTWDIYGGILESGTGLYLWVVNDNDEHNVTGYQFTLTNTLSSHTITAANLHGNIYPNTGSPRQSTFSRFVFTTNADAVRLTATTDLYNDYPDDCMLGVRVDGVETVLNFTAQGQQDFVVELGTAGTTRTVEFISGLETNPSGTVLGSYLDAVEYQTGRSFSITSPPGTGRILFYGDSITSGAETTEAPHDAFVRLLDTTYGRLTMAESWGARMLADDAPNATAITNFVTHILSENPSLIVFLIGTNDYGIPGWSATSFGSAYADVLDEINSQDSSVHVLCITPLSRYDESANSYGDTLGDYRTEIETACSSRSWALAVSGPGLLTYNATNFGASVVHPNSTGHAVLASEIDDLIDLFETPGVAFSEYSAEDLTDVILTSETPGVASSEYSAQDLTDATGVVETPGVASSEYSAQDLTDATGVVETPDIVSSEYAAQDLTDATGVVETPDIVSSEYAAQDLTDVSAGETIETPESFNSEYAGQDLTDATGVVETPDIVYSEYSAQELTDATGVVETAGVFSSDYSGQDLTDTVLGLETPGVFYTQYSGQNLIDAVPVFETPSAYSSEYSGQDLNDVWTAPIPGVLGVLHSWVTLVTGIDNDLVWEAYPEELGAPECPKTKDTDYITYYEVSSVGEQLHGYLEDLIDADTKRRYHLDDEKITIGFRIFGPNRKLNAKILRLSRCTTETRNALKPYVISSVGTERDIREPIASRWLSWIDLEMTFGIINTLAEDIQLIHAEHVTGTVDGQTIDINTEEE